MDHERRCRFEEVAAAGLALLGCADDPARPHLEVEREPRDRAVVGDRDRQAERFEGVGLGEVVEVGLDLALVGEVGVDLVEEVVLVRPPDHEHQRDQRGECLPGPAPAVAGLEQAPAEQAERREDRQHRGGEHRVAGEDREAGDGQDREGAEREDSGGDADPGAAPEEGEAEHDPTGGADHPRPLQHLAEPARPVEDEVDRAGLAFEGFDRVLGPGERVGRARRR